jgi:hypothetical protein
MAHVNRFHARSAATVALVAAIVALTACGGEHDDSSAAPLTTVSAAQGDAEQVVSHEPGSAEQDGSEPSATVALPDAGGRQLIVDVTVGVEVADVGAAVDQLIAVGDRHHAQVYASDIRLRDTGHGGGSIVFKVPPEEVEGLIADASALGRPVSRVQSTDDVTDRLTDLATRITSARQSVARVQALLDQTTSLGDVVMLEGELTTRQTTLEELLAEQRNVQNQAALATVTFELSAVPDEVLEAPPAAAPDDHRSIGDAFGRGAHAFVVAVAAILIFIGYTAPFLGVALVVLVLGWRVSRRRVRRNRSAAPLPPPARGEDPRTSEPDSAGAART